MAATFGNNFPKVAAMAQSFQREVGSLIIMLGRSPVVQENLLCPEVPRPTASTTTNRTLCVCALCVRERVCVLPCVCWTHANTMRGQ